MLGCELRCLCLTVFLLFKIIVFEFQILHFCLLLLLLPLLLLFVRSIYLCERQSYRERNLPCVDSLPIWPQHPGVTQAEVRSFFRSSTWVQSPEKGGRSEAEQPRQTGIHMGCQHCRRQRKLLLHHKTSHTSSVSHSASANVHPGSNR